MTPEVSKLQRLNMSSEQEKDDEAKRRRAITAVEPRAY